MDIFARNPWLLVDEENEGVKRVDIIKDNHYQYTLINTHAKANVEFIHYFGFTSMLSCSFMHARIDCVTRRGSVEFTIKS